MGKKKPEEMDKQRSIFVEGADKNGISATRANEIFDLISHFAGYGFNKSHSAAYGVVTFYTAWLKRHYPSEFYAALMTNDASSTAKVVRYITDARAHGIKVLPPDVNASDFSFTTSQGAIRFGLGAIKGIGSAPIEAIVEARTQKPFKSLFDFCERVDLRRCNKRVFEALIRAGAFDSCSTMGDDSAPTLGQIGRRRALMFASIDSAMERGAKAQRDKASGQASLFGMMLGSAPEAAVDNYVEAPAWDPRTVLTSEKETLGFYVSGHPLDRFRAEANRFADSTTETVREAQSRIEVRIACVLSGVRERPLKSGEGKMAFFNIEDHFGEVEAVVYARVYNDVAQYLNVDEPMLVKGMVRVTFDEGNEEEKTRTLMVDSILPLAEMRNRDVTRAYIEVDPTELSATRAAALDNLLRKHSGHCRTHLRMRIGTADVEFELPPEIATAASDSFVNELTAFFGEERVRFR
jgi:DNA polymerase-3 subunit alpha